MKNIYKYKSIILDNENDINDLFLYLKEISDSNLIFRGSTNKDYKLLPSLYRFNLNDLIELEKKYNFENDLFEGFENYIKCRRLEFYQTLQHYGIKTKLLDFSHDPFIGLLFAACDWPYTNDNSSKDGELIIFDRKKFQSVNEDDFPLIGDLLFEERNGINGIIVENKKVSFSKNVRFLNGVVTANKRLKKQKGCFLLFPNLSEDIKPIHKNGVYKRIIIRSKLKKTVINMLEDKESISMDAIY